MCKPMQFAIQIFLVACEYSAPIYRFLDHILIGIKHKGSNAHLLVYKITSNLISSAFIPFITSPRTNIY